MTNVRRVTAADGRLRLKTPDFSMFQDWLKRGAEQMFTARAGRMPQIEPVLKRSIPILIVIFLSIVAASRVIGVVSEQDRLEESLRQSTVLTLSAANSAFASTEATAAWGDRDQAEELLRARLPAASLPSGTFILLIHADGTIFASSPTGAGFVGMKLSELLPDMMTVGRYGESTGIIQAMIGSVPYDAAISLAGDKGGMIFVASSREWIGQQWRNEVALNVTLFAGTSAILLVVLYAYYTQIKRARDADLVFQESSLRVETALSRGRSGLWDFDFSTRRLYWSRSMYQMLGLPPSDRILTFSDAARRMHPEDQNFYAIARSVAHGEARNIDEVFRVRHADGHYVWLRARAQLVRTASGQMHLIGIAMDVSEQHRLAQRYAEADQRLADALECTSETFVLWDRYDRLVMCNAHFQQAYGLPDTVLVPGTDRKKVMAAAARPVVTRRIADPDRNGRSQTAEVQLADERWLQINERRTRDGGLVSVGTDITQLKRNTERLRKSERRLMATINDLSAYRQTLEKQKAELSIANSNYQAEKERAEAANIAKSDFLANMSHELRTPLNAILGFSEILLNQMFGELGSPKYNEYARDIHDSGKHLLNVINDILDMSKIEAGHMRLHCEAIDLAPLIEESLRFITIPASQKNIEVMPCISSGLTLVADRRAMKQIMLNILSNAVKFTNEGGRVSVKARKAGGAVYLTFADSGIGIPRAAIQKIGQPFEQVQNQYAKSKGGSGLGLAISRSLAALHGGKMKIVSRENEGTIICLRIPDLGTSVDLVRLSKSFEKSSVRLLRSA
jgi:two-component system, cell cycle sensor histidine kinase PleC